MVLDYYEELEISGKKYNLCLRNRCALKAERELDGKNLLMALASQPLSSNDLYVLFKWALIGGGHEMDDDECYELFAEANDEHSYVGVLKTVTAVLTKSGLLGSAKKVKAAMQAKA